MAVSCEHRTATALPYVASKLRYEVHFKYTNVERTAHERHCVKGPLTLHCGQRRRTTLASPLVSTVCKMCAVSRARGRPPQPRAAVTAAPPRPRCVQVRSWIVPAIRRHGSAPLVMLPAHGHGDQQGRARCTCNHHVYVSRGRGTSIHVWRGSVRSHTIDTRALEEATPIFAMSSFTSATGSIATLVTRRSMSGVYRPFARSPPPA